VSSLLTVEQRPASLWVQEGESANFTCNGTDGNRWEPAKGPKNLFVVSANGDEKNRGRVRGTLSTKEGDSSMYIGGSQPEDSATYPCTSTQCSSAPCSPHPNPGLLPLWDQCRGRVIVGRKREIQ
ncbi:hypothetical protein FD755_025762, partial [Muntiacus reevesi]